MAREVSEYFRTSPFATFAGKLTPETGEEDFVNLRFHDEFLRQLEYDLLQSQIRIRLIVAQVGGGKTWTLSWLYRHFSRIDHNLVIGIPRVELRGQPERGFMEAIFRGLAPKLSEIRAKLPKESIPSELRGTTTEYVWNAILDDDVFSMLSGRGGRLPVMGNIAPPSLTKTEGTMQLLLGLFRALYSIGYAQVVVLVDEVESIFIAYGKRDLFIFENYLRGIFDEFESDKGQTLPRLLILLAGTSDVLEQISPALVGKQTATGDVASALARRLGPMAIIVKDESDVLRIADYRIGKHRKRPLSQPFIPYSRDAILYAWKSSLASIGDFCKYLQSMYELALSEKAKMITLEYGKRAVAQYQESSSPNES